MNLHNSFALVPQRPININNPRNLDLHLIRHLLRKRQTHLPSYRHILRRGLVELHVELASEVRESIVHLEVRETAATEYEVRKYDTIRARDSTYSLRSTAYDFSKMQLGIYAEGSPIALLRASARGGIGEVRGRILGPCA
jgi:hypothetical protein